MPTIIAATDLTERSAHVVGRALRIAADLGAAALVVTVLPQDVEDATVAAATERLRQVTDSLGAPQAACTAARGPAETALATLAAAHDAALLVVGLHRMRPVIDALRLTTMERIVLAASAPVLLAHRPAQEAYAKVLGAVDFAPACAAALRMADRIAPVAELHAIHALHIPLIDRRPGHSPAKSRALAQAEERRAAWLAAEGLPARLHRPEIIPGGLHEVLAFRLAELSPDLLCIGTHAGADPTRLGNHARDLMRAPPCDVLVARPPAR